MSYSQLYEKDTYLNKGFDYIIGTDIIEYDISMAGYNISIYYNLLDDKTLLELKKLSKENKRIKLGLIQRNNKDYKEKLKQAFKDIRKEFFEANDIQDHHIVAIKKDAIFLLKPCTKTVFGNVVFAKKNRYTSYYHLSNLELYYNKKTIDIKGIDDSLLELHKPYMLEFLREVFKLNEEFPDLSETVKLIVEFSDEYKRRELPLDFYRELNKISKFKTNMHMQDERSVIHLDYVIDDEKSIYKDSIDITYNFEHVIVPLLRLSLN